MPTTGADRAPAHDTAVRAATLDGVLTFALMRHGAMLSAAEGSPERRLYEQALHQAISEIRWRFRAECRECAGTGWAYGPDSLACAACGGLGHFPTAARAAGET